jgi:DNA-binding protein HU-beta
MTKADLIAQIAKGSKLSKADAERALNSFIDITKKTLKKEKKMALAGFGSFAVAKRKARKGRNPQTGEVISIKASKTVRFKPAKALKDKL